MIDCINNSNRLNKILSQKNTKAGRLIIISAASGTGKTVLIKELCKIESQLKVSISYTTRQKRDNEIDGKDYFFTNIDKFQKIIKANKLLEHANVFGNYYGTSKDWVKSQLNIGNSVILEIDCQGAMQVSKIIPDCIKIFILPPTYNALHDRLLARGDDDIASIQRRLQCAAEEISHCHKYDFLMINDQFYSALEELRSIISAVQEDKGIQQTDLREFVKNLLADSQHIH